MTRHIVRRKMYSPSVSGLLGRAVVRRRGTENDAQLRSTSCAPVAGTHKRGVAHDKAERDARAIRATLLDDSRRAWLARLRLVRPTLDALWRAVADSDDRLAAMLLSARVGLPELGSDERRRLLLAIVSDRHMCRSTNALLELGHFDAAEDFDVELLLACSQTPHTALTRRICDHPAVQRELDRRPDAIAVYEQLAYRYAYWRAVNFCNFNTDVAHLADVLRHVDVSLLSETELARILFDGDRLSEMPETSAVAVVRQLAHTESAAAVRSAYAFARHFDGIVDTFSPSVAELTDQDYRVFSALLEHSLRSEQPGLSEHDIEAALARFRIPLLQPPRINPSERAAASLAAPCA